jgi:hypothetical protein
MHLLLLYEQQQLVRLLTLFFAFVSTCPARRRRSASPLQRRSCLIHLISLTLRTIAMVRLLTLICAIVALSCAASPARVAAATPLFPTPPRAGKACKSRYDGFVGSCVSTASCTGAPFPGLCPGRQICCVPETVHANVGASARRRLFPRVAFAQILTNTPLHTTQRT